MAEVTNRKSTVDEKISKVIEKHTQKSSSSYLLFRTNQKKEIAGTIFCPLENRQYCLQVLFYTDPSNFLEFINLSPNGLKFTFFLLISLVFYFHNYQQNASNRSIYGYYEPGLPTKS